MGASTGPILAVGAITLGNSVLVNGRPIDWRVPVGTGIAAGLLTLAEKPFPQAAPLLAWGALVTVLFVRVQPGVPSPTESFLRWWNQGR